MERNKDILIHFVNDIFDLSKNPVEEVTSLAITIFWIQKQANEIGGIFLSPFCSCLSLIKQKINSLQLSTNGPIFSNTPMK
jgi:hypothetical protein